jgi:membrane associated rhomboid family serine protease
MLFACDWKIFPSPFIPSGPGVSAGGPCPLIRGKYPPWRRVFGPLLGLSGAIFPLFGTGFVCFFYKNLSIFVDIFCEFSLVRFPFSIYNSVM